MAEEVDIEFQGADQTDKKTPDVSSEIEISSMKKPQKESETNQGESEQFNSFKELFKAIKNHKENGGSTLRLGKEHIDVTMSGSLSTNDEKLKAFINYLHDIKDENISEFSASYNKKSLSNIITSVPLEEWNGYVQELKKTGENPSLKILELYRKSKLTDIYGEMITKPLEDELENISKRSSLRPSEVDFSNEGQFLFHGSRTKKGPIANMLKTDLCSQMEAFRRGQKQKVINRESETDNPAEEVETTGRHFLRGEEEFGDEFYVSTSLDLNTAFGYGLVGSSGQNMYNGPIFAIDTEAMKTIKNEGQLGPLIAGGGMGVSEDEIRIEERLPWKDIACMYVTALDHKEIIAKLSQEYESTNDYQNRKEWIEQNYSTVNNFINEQTIGEINLFNTIKEFETRPEYSLKKDFIEKEYGGITSEYVKANYREVTTLLATTHLNEFNEKMHEAEQKYNEAIKNMPEWKRARGFEVPELYDLAIYNDLLSFMGDNPLDHFLRDYHFGEKGTERKLKDFIVDVIDDDKGSYRKTIQKKISDLAYIKYKENIEPMVKKELNDLAKTGITPEEISKKGRVDYYKNSLPEWVINNHSNHEFKYVRNLEREAVLDILIDMQKKGELDASFDVTEYGVKTARFYKKGNVSTNAKLVEGPLDWQDFAGNLNLEQTQEAQIKWLNSILNKDQDMILPEEILKPLKKICNVPRV